MNYDLGRLTLCYHCKCSKSEAPLWFFAWNCFKRFHQESFIKDRRRWLTSKSIPKLTGRPTGRLKGSTIRKGHGKRKKRTVVNSACFGQLYSPSFVMNDEYITQVSKTIFLAVTLFCNKTLMHLSLYSSMFCFKKSDYVFT